MVTFVEPHLLHVIMSCFLLREGVLTARPEPQRMLMPALGSAAASKYTINFFSSMLQPEELSLELPFIGPKNWTHFWITTSSDRTDHWAG